MTALIAPVDLTQTHDVLGAYHDIDFSEVYRGYSDPGTDYARAVLDGDTTSGYLIQLAAFRHLQDLRRSLSGVFDYSYDLIQVNNIMTFAALCPNVQTMEPTPLMPWENFMLTQMYGWRKADDEKRFTQANISVGRDQGKTYIMAINMCYSYLVEALGLSNQDFLVTSINFDQTKKLFTYIATMMTMLIQQEPFKSLAQETGLSIQNRTIIMRENSNQIMMISHEGGKYDGRHFTNAIFDEVGEVESREKIDKITSGQINTFNHQYAQISTAYPRPDVPFHEDQKIAQQAMEQDFKREADTTLNLIWSQDSLDETYKPDTWEKSNPLLGLPDMHTQLMQGLLDTRDRKLLAGRVSDFQNKNLNLWLQETADSFLKLADVERAIIDQFSIRGRYVYIGFDYSLFSDNTAIAFVFPYLDGDAHKFYVLQHSFIPWQKAGSLEAKCKQDGIDYRDAADAGFCTITRHPQGLIDDDQVYQWLMNFVADNDLQVRMFGYDQFGATTMTKQLELNSGWPIIPVRQRTSELKDPTKFLQELFIESNITRPDDPIMEKALLNADYYEDKVGIQIDKAKATYKIDVVDAIIDALYQGMYEFEDFADVNQKATEIDRMTPQQVADWMANNFSFGAESDGEG